VKRFVDAELGYRTRGQNGDEAHVDDSGFVRPRPDFMAQSFTAIVCFGMNATNSVARKSSKSASSMIQQDLLGQLGFVDAHGREFSGERGIISALWARSDRR